ncbi:ATP-binding cassette subfamily B protein [Kibdelosporangium banguiense]|uniref:ATP-binding cassette subfamily B protein n=1 Tax=Kibdelosporangium banguiense TaxID=1365924 RepID=A0ABS4TRP5_9PSEU|nr:ABC transporter ATP-binding protein [Kibdelosporangium banguiense]MBP2326664.1 ATP-binding cassette subfamily B protein [Kibdelosporangium banguiense]
MTRSVRRAAASALALPFSATPFVATVTVALTVFAGAAPATGAWLTMLLVDELTSGAASTGRAAFLAIASAVVGGLTIALLYLGGHLAEVVQQRVTLTVESRLFRRIATLPGLGHIEDPAFHDRLRLAEQAAQEAPGTISQFTQELIRSVVLLASFAGALLVVWPPMTLLLLASVVTAVLARLAIARREAATEEAWVATDRRRLFYRALLTDVRAAKEIRLFGLGSLLHTRMVDSLATVSSARLSAARRGMLVQSGLALLSATVTGAGTVVVAVGVVTGRSSVGDLVLFLGAVAGVQTGLSGVVVQLGETGRAVRLFGHYLDVLDTDDDLPVGTGTPVRPATIELRDVWFRYGDDGPWVLRGVNLTIPAGAAVGIVGVNGAGKSTLVKLLCRFYDPQRGTITWGGTDIRELDIAALRERIGVVFQEFMTYDLTAAENIGIGQLQQLNDRSRIVAAAEAARVAETVAALPNGYDTVLSRTFADEEQTGVTLSGGQWQRIALARCLMRTDAELMVLDEPTSGLDAEGEHRVHATLREHAEGRTRLLISHRLSALRGAEKIVTLVDGRIAEQGSHDELMNAGGEYARLFSLQADGYQDARVR